MAYNDHYKRVNGIKPPRVNGHKASLAHGNMEHDAGDKRPSVPDEETLAKAMLGIPVEETLAAHQNRQLWNGKGPPGSKPEQPQPKPTERALLLAKLLMDPRWNPQRR